MNVKQVLVVVTEDKIRLCLKDRISTYMADSEKKAEASRVRQAWQAPVGLLLSVVLAFTTANFVDRFNVSKDTWAAVFVMLGIVSTIWLLYTLWLIIMTRKVAMPPDVNATVDQIVGELQRATQSTVGTIQPVAAAPISNQAQASTQAP